MKYYVHVLGNQTGKRYIGLTQSPEQRLLQHNQGLSRWTAKFRPWCIIWTSVPLGIGEARHLELKMKAQKGGDGLKTLMALYGS